MAGTLTISTLSDGTNSTSATNPIRGSAKAWINFDGTNASIRASYNVSSITRNSTGCYTVTMTNAMPDASYCVNGAAGSSGSASGCWFTTGFNVAGFTTNNTTTSFRIQIFYTTSAIADTEFIYASVFR